MSKDFVEPPLVVVEPHLVCVVLSSDVYHDGSFRPVFRVAGTDKFCRRVTGEEFEEEDRKGFIGVDCPSGKHGVSENGRNRGRLVGLTGSRVSLEDRRSLWLFRVGGRHLGEVTIDCRTGWTESDSCSREELGEQFRLTAGEGCGRERSFHLERLATLRLSSTELPRYPSLESIDYTSTYRARTGLESKREKEERPPTRTLLTSSSRID